MIPRNIFHKNFRESGLCPFSAHFPFSIGISMKKNWKFFSDTNSYATMNLLLCHQKYTLQKPFNVLFLRRTSSKQNLVAKFQILPPL